MAHRRITEDDLLGRALELFRASGFEGVSVSDLSRATGLEKASLYYRYPGGKEEIAMAVLERVIGWFGENVFAPLQTDLSPRRKVSVVVEKLREFYGDGSLSCVLEVLSLPSGSTQVAATVRIAMKAWLKAFTEIARESGFSASESRFRAEEALVGIEGSLVLGRILGDAGAFQRVLKGLPDLLTKA
jgi:TetR/AcrR family transcriptional repressor of lmrAB and yxaGH operons